MRFGIAHLGLAACIDLFINLLFFSKQREKFYTDIWRPCQYRFPLDLADGREQCQGRDRLKRSTYYPNYERFDARPLTFVRGQRKVTERGSSERGIETSDAYHP